MIAYPIGFIDSEWFYTGDSRDLGEPCGNCDLCGTEIRYEFKIANEHDIATKWIGSECIKKFSLGAIDEHGRRLDAADTSRIVDRDRREMTNEARRRATEQKRAERERVEEEQSRRALAALRELGSRSPQFSSFVSAYFTYGSFTPKQLNFVFWKMRVNRVAFRPEDFHLSKKQLGQLWQLQPFQLEQIWPCIPPEMQRALAHRRRAA